MWNDSWPLALIVLCVLAGAALVLLAGFDIFYTVLFPGSGRGPVRRPVERVVRACFRQAGRLPAGRRRRVLAYAGPTEITVTLVAWFLLLLTGWALVYLPALGAGVTASKGGTETSWWTAVYLSGWTLTTLGLGDLVATTPVYRIAVVTEAATGFMSFTMAISYFISVYDKLSGRQSLALALHQRTHGTGRGSELVRAWWEEGPVAAALDLASTAEQLRQVVQTHGSYPVLRSFHYQQDYDSLPEVLLTCWEAVTLLRTSLDAPDTRPELQGSALVELEASARALTGQVLGEHASRATDAPSRAQREAWRRHHAEAVAELAAAGVPVRQGAVEDYLDARAGWDAALGRLAQELVYEWPDGLDPAPAA